MKNKEKAVKEIKRRIMRRERWATILNSFSALGLAVVSLIIALHQEKFDCLFLAFVILSIVFILMGGVSIILLFCNLCKIRKYSTNYNYYSESKRITDILLTSLKRIGFAKTNSILRSTYGTVPDWHPIDYCKNVLVYDIHEHLRDICVKIKESVIDLAPQEFNDDMVTVDLAFEYPSDQEFLLNKKTKGADNKDKNDLENNDCKQEIASLEKFEKRKMASNYATNNQSSNDWKVITSGDRTSSRVDLHSYLTDMNSFYSYLQTQGYCFSNDKTKLEKENHYIWSSKDSEYDRAGSIVGTVIELKNDNPEKVFVRVFLTITTYGRKLVESNDLLDEDVFKKLFKETIINSFKTTIETELAQMFIRHGIKNGFINRHTGQLFDE